MSVVANTIRYRFTCEYIGTRFHGWQKQSGDIATVSGMLEQALNDSKAGSLVGPVYGCGRTDTGVHALGQTGHFDFAGKRNIPGDSMRDIINAWLPGSHRNAVRVLRCEQVSSDFHARFNCTSRVYVYRITTATNASSRLFENQLSWWMPTRIDVNRLKECAAVFTGEHDLVAFRANGCGAATTVRTLAVTVDDVSQKMLDPVRQHGILDEVRGTECQHIYIRAEQSSFLYKQVRLMVSALVDVGIGVRGVDDVREMLATGKVKTPLKTAPPHGLYFVAANYDPTKQRPKPNVANTNMDDSSD